MRLHHEGSMIGVQCQLMICRGHIRASKGTFQISNGWGASGVWGVSPHTRTHMRMHTHAHTHIYTCIEIANGCQHGGIHV